MGIKWTTHAKPNRKFDYRDLLSPKTRAELDRLEAPVDEPATPLGEVNGQSTEVPHD